jgi:nicotinamide-nucleotide amidase
VDKQELDTLAREVGRLLKENKLTLGAVESATGGLISHLVTNISGSSDYYQGSITSYSNEIKMRLVGVKSVTLEKCGSVSSKVAEEMADGGRRVLGVDICVADTGIAGPTGATTNKPIGLFYLGLSHQSGTFNRKNVFKGNREQNKEQAAAAALQWVKEYLESLAAGNQQPQAFRVKQVVTCFLESGKRILILRRSEQVSTYRGHWAAVSGYIESTPDAQALIEIREETGLSDNEVTLVSRGTPLHVTDAKLNTTWIVHPYLFHTDRPERIRLDREHVEAKWINANEMGQYSTVPGLKDALDIVTRNRQERLSGQED